MGLEVFKQVIESKTMGFNQEVSPRMAKSKDLARRGILGNYKDLLKDKSNNRNHNEQIGQTL